MKTPLALLSIALLAAPLRAQSTYRNSDAGRPLRVEDAAVAERYALEAQLAPVRVERAAGGGTRWRLEPKLAYGVARRTELELRTSIVHLPAQPGLAAARTGVPGVGVGLAHALNAETPAWPALAFAAEAVLPVGALAPASAIWTAKGMLTRTFRVARVHLNAAAGSWSVRSPLAIFGCGPGLVPLPDAPPCDGSNRPFVPDLPCDVAPFGDHPAAMPVAPFRATRCGAGATAATGQPPASLTRSRDGRRWFAGAAVDRALAVRSVLLSAELFAERFEGLNPRADWTATFGVRHQLSSRIVLDGGVGRRFAGVSHATLATAGIAVSVAARALVR